MYPQQVLESFNIPASGNILFSPIKIFLKRNIKSFPWCQSYAKVQKHSDGWLSFYRMSVNCTNAVVKNSFKHFDSHHVFSSYTASLECLCILIYEDINLGARCRYSPSAFYYVLLPLHCSRLHHTCSFLCDLVAAILVF